MNFSLLVFSCYLLFKNLENLFVFNYIFLYIGLNNFIGVMDIELFLGRMISFNVGGGFVEFFGFGSELLCF